MAEYYSKPVGYFRMGLLPGSCSAEQHTVTPVAVFDGQNEEQLAASPMRRQEQRLQITQKIKSAYGWTHTTEVAFDPALFLGLAQGGFNAAGGEPGARGEISQGKSLPQPQRIEHVFKRQIGMRYVMLLRQRLARQRLLHVAARIA